MPDPETMALLQQIAKLLTEGDPGWRADEITKALSDSTGRKLGEFLVSNELWGGAGSIADEALISDEPRRDALENLLIKLGKLQLASGQANVRTEMWVTGFEKWQARQREQ